MSAYVVDGLRSSERVKPILDMAISRFNAFARMERELEEGAQRAGETASSIDRAKGILMKNARAHRGGGLCPAAQDRDEPEPQDQRHRPEPGHRRRPARLREPSHERRIRHPRRLHAAARQRPCWSPPSEKGFAEREGDRAACWSRESSWANIRDRLAVGHFDVAHMLAPMPIACNLGLTPLAAPHDRADGARPRRQCGDGVERALGGDGGRRRARRSRPGCGRARRSRPSVERRAGGRAAPLRRGAPAFGRTITSSATGWRRAASSRTAMSRSSSCRRR